MDGPRDCYTEWSKTDRGREIAYDIPYMWNLKRNDTNELTSKIGRDREGTYGYQGEAGGRMGERTVREFGMDMCTLLYLKWITGGFPAGSVVKNLPVNAGDTGLILGMGRSHMPGSNESVCHDFGTALTSSPSSTVFSIMRSPNTATKSSPHSLQLEKSPCRNWRPSTANK